MRVRGGVKFYRGSARGARDYVEAGRSRADDYYLGEGDGLARRYVSEAVGGVRVLDVLGGDAYESWVGGFDPVSGVPRGRLRTDANALRFAEVVVNGPKSWSLAAELHPEIGLAYAAAQDRAAEALVGWFGAHATTRVGPRGGQVATAVERIEACAVAHRTSRCGDPHRHIHLQLNARVFAAGKWRGIDSVAVRESIAAAQGIGHAAVVCDPDFRAALAARGYTLDPDSGEIRELAPYVPGLSKRAAQIAEQVAGYEAEWRAANPGQEPGPGLRRVWDGRAWAQDRPDKAAGAAAAGEVLHERWTGQLRAAGYRDPTGPVELVPTAVGALDRDAAAAVVLSRVGSVRSGFNPADLRGQAELLIARAGVVTEAAVRTELAEDITARAVAAAVPLLGDRAYVPDHVRAWTTVEALTVEAELAGRFAARAAADAVGGAVAGASVVRVAAAVAGVGLDPAQAQAVAALGGSHALVLVTGAAGAGKTTMLAAARAGIEAEGQALVVVTPTLKAARGAAAETGARTGSAAWLVHQHGWRWDEHGTWTRLGRGDVDPQTGSVYSGPRVEAALMAGDLLVIDEAGMLDQDTARALMCVADEAGARVALVGDPHQLPAVGRGGVLDLAQRWTEAEVTLDVIHRFTATVEVAPGITGEVPDAAYADLSLLMRRGAAGDPAAVFDTLTERGQVQVHPDGDGLQAAVAEQAAAAVLEGRPAAVCVATNEAAQELNTAIRERLVEAGHVEDQQVLTTTAGARIGVGDTVVTRANDRDLDVANRDTWTVTAVHEDGSLTVAAAHGSGLSGERRLPGDYAGAHVELGYASTVHGVQGATAHTGHLVLDENTSAAAAYVGMTRGRTANTVHLIAADIDTARERWIEVAGRDRADLGPAAAREAAQKASTGYTAPAPSVAGEEETVLSDWLRAAMDEGTEQAAAQHDQAQAVRAPAAGVEDEEGPPSITERGPHLR